MERAVRRRPEGGQCRIVWSGIDRLARIIPSVPNAHVRVRLQELRSRVGGEPEDQRGPPDRVPRVPPGRRRSGSSAGATSSSRAVAGTPTSTRRRSRRPSARAARPTASASEDEPKSESAEAAERPRRHPAHAPSTTPSSTPRRPKPPAARHPKTRRLASSAVTLELARRGRAYDESPAGGRAASSSAIARDVGLRHSARIARERIVDGPRRRASAALHGERRRGERVEVVHRAHPRGAGLRVPSLERHRAPRCARRSPSIGRSSISRSAPGKRAASRSGAVADRGASPRREVQAPASPRIFRGAREPPPHETMCASRRRAAVWHRSTRRARLRSIRVTP